MKSILLFAAINLGFTIHSSTPSGPNKWFPVNPDGITGYGSISNTQLPSSMDFYEAPPLNGEPDVSTDPTAEECLLNSERICAALFSTDTSVAAGNFPIAFADEVVLGEYRHW